MLQRDLSRQRCETEWREADRKRIEMELQKAKRDMESEDLLDRIADNPSGRTFLYERFEILTAFLLKTPKSCGMRHDAVSWCVWFLTF
jgi:hypothetical protein